MFINPLTIDLHFDLHILQMKWIETEIKIVWMDRGGWAALKVLNFLKNQNLSDRSHFSGQMWRGGHQIFLETGEGVVQNLQTEAGWLLEGGHTFQG